MKVKEPRYNQYQEHLCGHVWAVGRITDRPDCVIAPKHYGSACRPCRDGIVVSTDHRAAAAAEVERALRTVLGA